MKAQRLLLAVCHPRAARPKCRCSHAWKGFVGATIVGLVLACIVGVVVVVGAPRAWATGSLAKARARATAINQEIAALDAQLAGIVNRYAVATERLQVVNAAIAATQRQLKVAELEVGVAQRVLSARAVAMYKEPEASLVDVVVGSSSFSDILTQLTFLQQLSQYDNQVLEQVIKTKQEIADRQAALKVQREDARVLVKQQASERARIRAALSQRQQTLGHLRGEIQRLQATLRRPVVTLQKVVTAVAPDLAPPGEGGGWWPLISDAAKANGISAEGLYRLMLIESGGNESIVGGAGGRFCGLFQYWPGTWKASWNPWRDCSIFSGAAQIKATALAIKMGKGPYWWNPSYQWAFGTD
jgi:hypothetical protein